MIVPRYTHMPHWQSPLICAPAAGGSLAHRPTILEIGPGRGEFLFHLAATNPNALVWGIEIKRRRFEKLCARREQLQLPNVALIHGDARAALPAIVDDAPVDDIYIQFPDPWPKRRHGHHRLITSEFLAVCARALATGGELWFITDALPYAETVAAMVRDDPEWQSAFPQAIVTACPDAYPTHFAKKWRAAGRTIYYQRYRKRSAVISSGSA